MRGVYLQRQVFATPSKFLFPELCNYMFTLFQTNCVNYLKDILIQQIIVIGTDVSIIKDAIFFKLLKFTPNFVRTMRFLLMADKEHPLDAAPFNFQFKPSVALLVPHHLLQRFRNATADF